MANKKTTLIKTQKEIQIMQELAKVHKEIFEEIKKISVPGITGYDVDKLVGNMCEKYGILAGFKGVYNFPANLCISIDDCVVHGVPTKKMIFKEGDLVKFDFGAKDRYFGLNTDAAFSMIIGEGPHDTKIKKFMQVCQEALYKGISKAVVGNKVGDISNAIQKYVESNGYKIVKDLTGHGIGYSLHEKPYIPNFGKPYKGEMLKENMTLAIEPIIGFSSGKIIQKGGFELYISDGSMGAQFEHTIVVKRSYPEIII